MPYQPNEKQQAEAAQRVLQRMLGVHSKNIKLTVKTSRQNDFYESSAAKGVLHVTASSASALTRGVYDYLRKNHMGMVDWARNTFNVPAKFPDATKVRRTSPFKIRQAYNVVTAGYTTPYWTWAEWQNELDRQALHGFTMLMASVATEAIAIRVWKKLGLTQAEIDSFYVSPSLLPWQRMGNICNVGGTLPQTWHADQIVLQHNILKRMRELNMEPIVQSFAGFVPKALRRIYPTVTLHSTLWNAGFPPAQRPVLLMPGDTLFKTITKMYMEEWRKEFGDAKYFLVDSFNELELPKTDKSVPEQLAEYGKFTYDAIHAGKADATWVIQGWMFGYQRHIWSPERVQALFSKVPDEGVLILDYANDYANSWEPVNGFHGKQWVYGFVPNMGGKTAYTGDMNLYASGASRTLASPKKNNLTGFSISGEGLENNGVIYELLTDVAWSSDAINLDNWLKEYSINRYGACPDAMKESWTLLRKSSYSNLIDHPQFNWQTGSFQPGRIDRSPEFQRSVALFLSCRTTLKNSKNFEADALERAAILLGLKAEEWFHAAAAFYDVHETTRGDQCGARGIELLTALDRLMESHPLNRLSRWVNLAAAHSDDSALQKFYRADARRIVTVWGPPVNDYACRIWSGLTRDFYRERMRTLLVCKKENKTFNKNAWELNWVENSVISECKPYPDPLEAAASLVDNALHESIPAK